MSTIKYRDAITGEYVSADFARENPDTTVSEFYEGDEQVAQQTGYIPEQGEYPGVDHFDPKVDGSTSGLDLDPIKLEALTHARLNSKYHDGIDTVLSNAAKIEAYLRGQG